ncbi:5-deoxy-glucuronate isomerase [Planotetraspora kaengkrachanensis]|uniref:5-deoxy-glucuronate isomerase n=1 Tax=Planotetraspora kaengkrachanensis TaxID=575193 RepID=A0A8J3PZH2_9ACTN|nr:5-deoxy-glucuronate isomerase [Planotetraspora kaengkrachanensis]GIG83872.1 5-deoxy-glucuronate isomerase [Planotetraspora kaengkrachanensis]
MNDNERWVRPFGTAAAGEFEVSIDDGVAGWTHTSLRVATLEPGGALTSETGGEEILVVPLRGGMDVEAVDQAGERHEARLTGRDGVFAGPTDVAYVPRGARLTLRNPGADRVRVALCGARAAKRETPPPFRHMAVSDVPVELRGAGTASREVRNFGVPQVLDADSIIACEVVTPAGNWSSYPPHKHDEEREGVETELEEIYYFEVGTAAGGPAQGADPVGYQRVYGTDARPIDVLAEVRSGDVVLVPHGWHGPAMAPPGYDLYYLNVMAGPGATRAWLICDDPAHGWVRDSWAQQDVDPRLPIGGLR